MVGIAIAQRVMVKFPSSETLEEVEVFVHDYLALLSPKNLRRDEDAF